MCPTNTDSIGREIDIVEGIKLKTPFGYIKFSAEIVLSNPFIAHRIQEFLAGLFKTVDVFRLDLKYTGTYKATF